MKIKSYLKLARIKHWLKNVLVFLPLVFGLQIFDVNKLIITLLGTLSFCFISSAVYIINDIKDVENDKKHKVKKNRPIASGAITITEAIIFMLGLVVISLLINVLVIKSVWCVLLLILYLLINIAYSCKLKNVPILDIVILVAGFVLRVVYGANLTGIELSKWLYLTVMSGSFFMGFGKRRNELLKQGNDTRKVLKYYSREYLDKFMYVCLVLTIVFYTLWSIDETTISRLGNDYIVYTVPIVLVIFMKYCLNIEGDSYGDPVDVLTSDKILIGLVLLFTMIMFLLMYI